MANIYFGDAESLENNRTEEIGLVTPTPALSSFHAKDQCGASQVYHSLGQANMQGIVPIPSLDADTSIGNESWCKCVFLKDGKN